MLDNNINEENIHSLKKSFSENVYDRKRITLEKTSSFSFLSVLKYNMIYMLFLSKPENMITKVQVHRKKGYTESLIRTQQRAVTAIG